MGSANHSAPAPPVGRRLHASRGIILTQGFRLIVRVGTVASLARLLAPEQYGVYGMAALVHGLATVVQDFGLGALTLRQPVLSDNDRSAYFWLNAAAGAMLALVVAGLGPVVASFYHEPFLQRLLPVIAVTFLLNGLYSQLRAQLAREQRFGELNWIDILSVFISSAAAVLAARRGAGVWALAILPLVAETVTASGVWYAQRWRPRRWPRGFSARTALASAAGVSGHDVLRYLQRNTDQFFVSRWLGPGTLGLYGRAIQLVTLPGQYLIDPLAAWVVSTLGGLQETPVAARIFWGRIVNGLVHLTLPFAVMIFCMPADVLRLFFGAAWTPGAPVLQALTGALVAQPVLAAEAWLLIAIGRNRRLVVWSGLTLLTLVGACGLALSHGAAAIAATTSGVLLLAAVAAALLGLRGLPVQAGDVARAVMRPMVLGLIAVLAILGLFAVVRVDGTLLRLGLCTVITTACWGAGWWWPGVRAELRSHFLVQGA